MAEKHMNKCSPPQAIKEMQIKTTLRFYLIADRIATPSRTTTTNVGKDVMKKEPLYTSGENVNSYNYYGK
jgi:hypothetical protein